MDISKLRKRNKISSLLVYVLHKREIRHFHALVVQKRERNVKKVWCTCEVVVLLIKPIVFLPSRCRPRGWILKSVMPDRFFTAPKITPDMASVHTRTVVRRSEAGPLRSRTVAYRIGVYTIADSFWLRHEKPI